jgi:flagellar motor switch protein FliN/FliY
MKVENLENLDNTENEKNTEEKTQEFNIDLEFLYDVPLHLNVEVGRAKKLFKDIIKLKEGDIIKLDKNIEDYLDIYLNHKLFAIGELVIVNDKYSVRLVDLV